MFYKKIFGIIFSMNLCLVAVSCSKNYKATEAKLVSEEIKPIPQVVNNPKASGPACVPVVGKLSRSSCAEGEFCLSTGQDKTVGLCLKDCGAKVDDRLVKDQAKCPDSWRCLTRRNADLSVLGNFCSKPQDLADMPCDAPFDKEACSSGMSCLPLLSETDEGGNKAYFHNRCKNECLEDSVCSKPGYSCLKPKFARIEAQLKPGQNTSVSCSPKDCQNQAATCSCDKDKGFSCRAIVLGVDRGVCVRSLGVCGQGLALARLDDFKGNSYFGPNCNEITDNRFCRSEASTAKTLCKPVGKNAEGACIAMCSAPSIDRNADGIIAEDEKGIELNCGENLSCQTNIARKLGLYVFVQVEKKPKICDFSQCQSGQPCPDQCGAGDAECLAVGVGSQKKYLCGAPYGLCEAK